MQICDAYRSEVGAYRRTAPPGDQPRRRLGTSLPNMSSNEPQGGKSTAPSPSIAHTVCHDCDEHEELHHAKRPEDAKQLALEAAIEHGREHDHDVAHDLIAEPASMTTCGPDVGDTEVVRR